MDFSSIVDVLSVIAVVSGLLFAGQELRQFQCIWDISNKHYIQPFFPLLFFSLDGPVI
jgi:hypothetical protein